MKIWGDFEKFMRGNSKKIAAYKNCKIEKVVREKNDIIVEIVDLNYKKTQVDLVKGFPTSIWSQKSASIQPRTDRLKFDVALHNFPLSFFETGEKRPRASAPSSSAPAQKEKVLTLLSIKDRKGSLQKMHAKDNE